MLGPSSRKIYYANADEVLTGKVNGDDASDIEERAAQYHQKNNISFWFRVRINPLSSKPMRSLSKLEQLSLQHAERAQRQGMVLPTVTIEAPPPLLTTKRANVIGELEIDILSEYGGIMYPIMIQGEISHFMTPAQKEKDFQKISRINNSLYQLGAHPAVIIPFWVLRDQQMTDQTMRNGYATGWNMSFYDL